METIAKKEALQSFRVKIQKLLGMRISERENLELFKKYGYGGIVIKLYFRNFLILYRYCMHLK
jgi:hypothetical protein